MHLNHGQIKREFEYKIAVAHAVNAVVGHIVETEFAADLIPVDRIGCSGKRTRAERQNVGSLIAVVKSQYIALKHLRIGKQLMRKRHRLGTLQMRVAAHDGVGVVFRDTDDCLHEVHDKLFDGLYLIAQIHAHIERNLVVAAARGVKPLSGVADAFG